MNHAPFKWILLIAIFFTMTSAAADAPMAMCNLKSALNTSTVAVGDMVEFQVAGLDKAVQEKVCDPTTWQLVMDAMPLSGSKPLIDLDRNLVRFPLDRVDADKAVWTKLLGEPPIDGTRAIIAGVRIDATHELLGVPGSNNRIALQIFTPLRAAVGFLLLVLAVGFFVLLAQKSDLVRDSTPVTPPAGERRPYSLGRCQLAFWSFLVAGSFLFICLVTGSYNGVITPQAFVLMGISSATGLAAATIDVGKPLSKASVGFLDDLLTDTNGITIYRYQLMLWTVLLGFVYVFSVYQTLSTPNFDANLLTLMGISSGTYLGFKIPEKQP